MKNLLLIGPLALFLSTGVNAADVAMDTVPAKPDAQVTLMNWSEQPYNACSRTSAFATLVP